MESPFPSFEPGDSQDDQVKREPSPPKRIRDIPLRSIFPTLLTLLAICSGLTAIRLAFDERFELAIAAIVLAAILDFLDGRVARFLKSTSRFGAEMDSLADFVNFGVAPAMILFLWGLDNAGNFGWICALFYVLAAGLRLARFNVMLDDPNQPKWQKNFFIGVPAPAAALCVLLPLYLGKIGLEFIHDYPKPVSVYALMVGLLMISSLPTWSGKAMGQRIRRDVVLPIMLLAVFIVAMLISYPWEVLAVAALGYLCALPVGLRAWQTARQNAGDK